VTAPASPKARPSAALDRYEAVIGIEIHCQLKTASKMFCSCSTDYEGAAPNTHCCPVCLGLPGALPTINRRAVEHVLAAGLAIEATVPEATRWDRKNYFYPDLPKGYQISQYDLPLASNGRLAFDTSDGPFTVRITRAHLEEDTAKLIHATGADGSKVSLVDFNRSGAPLMEIVTEPDIRTAEQARRYAEELQLLLRAIGASDAEMENGQMRVEANVSIRPRGTEPFGTRVEVKNMNSFRSVERAIAFEIERQAAALDAGEPLTMETRGWDDGRQATYHMRPKEQSDDYRYFPEPDLPPLHLDSAWLEAIRAALPELPAARRERYQSALGLSPYDATVLVNDPTMSAAFEAILAAAPDLAAKDVANLVTGEYGRWAREIPERGEAGLVGQASAASLADLVRATASGALSRTNAREVLAIHVRTGRPTREIVEREGFAQISDTSALDATVDAAIAANPAAVADYRAGKAQAIGFLVGQVMKATRGQANAALVTEALRRRLDTSGE
jgi:aspartyl-tRNA(Asn)/glutamyl-tRNA(Gln) amidotransferase subunit B